MTSCPWHSSIMQFLYLLNLRQARISHQTHNKERTPHAQVTPQKHKQYKMPRQDALSTPNPTNLTEVFFNNNYLDETQDTDFKSIVINFFKKSMCLKMIETLRIYQQMSHC